MFDPFCTIGNGDQECPSREAMSHRTNDQASKLPSKLADQADNRTWHKLDMPPHRLVVKYRTKIIRMWSSPFEGLFRVPFERIFTEFSKVDSCPQVMMASTNHGVQQMSHHDSRKIKNLLIGADQSFQNSSLRIR